MKKEQNEKWESPRSHTDPTLLNNSEMAAEGPGDLPVSDLRTMEELSQPSLNGRVHEDVTALYSGSRNLPGNTITNPKEDLKGMTTRSGTAYQGPTIPTTSPSSSSSSPVVERETDVTKDMVHPTNNESTEDVQPLVVMTESPILNFEPVTSPIIEPVASPVSAPRPNQRPLIPYPSRLQDQKLSLADLGASINLMPLSMWNKLYLPDLSPTYMTLELTDHLISHPVGVAEDVFIKVGTFHFPVDFVAVDFDADPRVPLIIKRSFLKTERALIDVFKGELTLRVSKVAITFNLDQASRYSANYNDMTSNHIDVIDMAWEEYSQEVLGFFDVIASGNLTPYYDQIVSTTSPTLTPFGNSDFLLKEVDAFLALEDDSTSPEVNQSYLDSEGDIILLKAFMNDDPSLAPLNQGNYLPEVCKELKICEAKTDKSSIDDPPKVELKNLPPHHEYSFLEGDEKLAVIIVKYLSIEEKTALITVLKRKPRSLAHAECLPTAACLLGYAMHQARFREKMLKRCEDTNLCLKWEKSHFMVKEGIVLGHQVSKEGIEVDKAKVDVIAKLPHPKTVKGIRSFLGHAGFYRRKVQLNELNELNELRDQAYENSPIYKEKTKRLYDLKIKDRVFNIGDRVLIFNSQLKIFSGKLKSRWSGPFTISHVFPYGTDELSQPDGPNFKVNGHRLKHYFGEDVPKMVIPDLQTFPRDQ
uniref:Reverse transcriptase domain-containing protein n=1 Tax=Tanacetum cinerariifolium TaxID=118510 RepID=A0A6L2P8U6_TANCI|nr:reverse transcriptase domain-containing protein [Tanacetum cinerariifolium]